MYLFGVIPYILCKRGLDILLSLVALLVLWPVLLVVAVIVRCQMGAPVLFCQLRPVCMASRFGSTSFGPCACPEQTKKC
jgi:lipopolysaccharide/colanic/teichoic acid biosynthesis glycosyltransferase